ncbi:spermidine synthase [Cupriavidus metallidurans]|jgi:spermidine synthase|uniref:Polyamine aminopropyltransferase n=1 Tax=Cupriavidus metallidurans (strain ATCC 43123 / DSM 2839 / NBRC 102507 / CH34) TaxID=266264 RepID=Q1LJ22_CUPMC|nr:Spermidine synthase (Putrescine aminopropyltransferase) (SPDSY) [Cupriavidus metallidurans CH34]KWW34617.1 Polyamine aminopropyltransferase [Cupriavidus metallidurans]QGS29321.1 spermidine synthase [Cupriavidus metallidurans]
MREPDGGKTAILAEAGGIPGTDPALRRGTQAWTEWLIPGVGTTLGEITLLAAACSPYQQIEIGESAHFGRIFRLDGRVMSTEADAWIQHELMVAPMAATHGAPRSALVVGGGDGGSAFELLRIPTMREVVVAELDGEVVRLAREWLRGIHQGALDEPGDPRLSLAIGEGLGLMEAFARAGRQFDLIVYDLTEADDGSPAAALFSPHGLHTARRCLAPGGAMSLHLGPPLHRPETARRLLARLRHVFRHVAPLTTFVPAYGALWGIALASDALDIAAQPADKIATRLQQWQLEHKLRAYHAYLHPALFVHPRHVQAIFDSGSRPA